MSHPSIPCSFSEFEAAASEFLHGLDAGITCAEACNGFKCLTLMLCGLDYTSDRLSEVDAAQEARLAHDQAEQKMREHGFPTPHTFPDRLAELFH